MPIMYQRAAYERNSITEERTQIEIRDKYATLSNEISSLKQALDALRKEPASSMTTKSSAAGKPRSKRSYAMAASTLRPAKLATSSKPVTTKSAPLERPAVAGAQQVQRVKEPTTESARSVSKIKVNGARRIWNTVPTCSARAVATTIAKLIPANLDLQIKRKTKRLASKTIWWFFSAW